jgi:hypothetical protein
MIEPLFDMPDQPGDETPRCTEREMLEALHRKFGQVSKNGGVLAPRYVCAEHVRASAGFYCRTADFIAADTWGRGKYAIHGVEVKVSRGDWQRELRKPEKAGAFAPWVHYWWLAAADDSIVHPGELPGDWGLLVLKRGRLYERPAAPRRSPIPVPPESMASLLRAVAKTAARRAHFTTTEGTTDERV